MPNTALLVASSDEHFRETVRDSIINLPEAKIVAEYQRTLRMHKLIMTSSVYRQGSEVSKEASDRDADNVYLSHFNRRRLMPEEIRDGMLQSGMEQGAGESYDRLEAYLKTFVAQR